jgi:hypothetical protein
MIPKQRPFVLSNQSPSGLGAVYLMYLQIVKLQQLHIGLNVAGRQLPHGANYGCCHSKVVQAVS